MRLKRWWADPSIRTAIVVFVVMRVVLSGIGLLFWPSGRALPTADPIARSYYGIEPVTEGWRGALLGMWQRFDTIHYQRIAASGYADPDLVAFPPLYPLSMRLVATLLAGDTLLAGWLVSNVCALLAMVLLYRLAARLYDEAVARRSLIYLALFPTSFFLLAPYTESLFLFLALASCWLARQGRLGWAGVIGAACALTRFAGIFTFLPIVYELWKRRSPLFSVSWLAAAWPPIALGVYWGAGRLSGWPSPMAMQQEYYQRITDWPWVGIIATVQRLVRGEAISPEWFDLLMVLVMAALTVMAWRRIPRQYGWWMAAVLVFNLMQYRIPQPLSGQARFTLAMFPAFIVLGAWACTPWRRRLIVYPCAALWLYFAGQFALWGWVG